MTRAYRSVALAAAITAAVFSAGFCKIADLDFWWHLKTGQVIAATHSIPRQDVYSFTAAGREYVDHEWLFQLFLYVIYAAGGPAGIAIAKCLVISTTLTLVALYAVRRGASHWVAGGLTFLGISAGVTRFIERPEIFSVLFAVVTYIVLDSYSRRGNRGLLLVLPVVCALWSNVHAAVIVGLVIQLLFVAALAFERKLDRPVVLAFIGSIVASGINPFGFRVLTVPFELTRIIDSGVINNEEWRHPSFMKTPFFYIALLAAAALIAWTPRLINVLVACFLAYLGLKYIRNVALFAAFVPMLTAPSLARLRERVWGPIVAASGAASLLFVLLLYYPFQRGVGEASYFPDGLARFVRQNTMRGHMLNSYSFGGYLIWSLWPQHHVFVDGRNEVYLPLLERLAFARRDSRAWNTLLRDYQIEFAVLDYVDALDRITVVAPDGTLSTRYEPVTASRFPRSRWALVNFDDDGMVFVRRGGANEALLRYEYTSLYPEGRGYQKQLVATGALDRSRAVSELERKLREEPGCRRARLMMQEISGRRQ